MSEGKLVNKGELARVFGVSTTAVDGWIRRGCPAVERGRSGRSWRFDTAEVARWREERAEARAAERRGGRLGPDAPADVPSDPRERAKWILDRLILGEGFLVPWSHEHVVTLPEFEVRMGFRRDAEAEHASDDGEVLIWLAYGLPILPPERGSKVARISLPHADLWRVLMGALVAKLGGDGTAHRIGSEANRLRGVPAPAPAPTEEAG